MVSPKQYSQPSVTLPIAPAFHKSIVFGQTFTFGWSAVYIAGIQFFSHLFFKTHEYWYAEFATAAILLFAMVNIWRPAKGDYYIDSEKISLLGMKGWGCAHKVIDIYWKKSEVFSAEIISWHGLPAIMMNVFAPNKSTGTPYLIVVPEEYRSELINKVKPMIDHYRSQNPKVEL